MNQAFLQSRTSNVRWPVHDAMFENTPGVTPSFGYVRLPVLLDYDWVAAVAEEKTPPGPQKRALTHSQDEVTQQVIAVEPFFNAVQGSASVGQRKTDLREFFAGLPAPTDTEALELPKARDLLNSEWDLVLESDTDGTVTTVVIERLRVLRIVPEMPAGLNAAPFCKVELVDRRMDWAKPNNFSDDINVFKGITINGQRGFWRNSAYNPNADNPRPWSLKEYVAYLLVLLGENPSAGVVTGSRGEGIDFSAYSANFSSSFSDADITIEGWSGQGDSPARTLHRLSERYGFDIWLVHQSQVLICAQGSDKPGVPTETGELRDLKPDVQNLNNRRSRRIIVHGPPVEVQEAFSFVEGVDFDYVIYSGGEWQTVDDVLAAANGFRKDELAVLAALSNSGDLDKMYILETAIRDGKAVQQSPGFAKLTTDTVHVLATGAFRYIRLRRTGQYGKKRRPTPNLSVLQADGSQARPLGFGVLPVTFKIRTESLDKNGKPSVTEAEGRLARAKKQTQAHVPTLGVVNLTPEQKAGQIEETRKDLKAAIDANLAKDDNRELPMLAVNAFQTARLVDADNLVFKFDEPWVYPLEQSPLTDFSGTEISGQIRRLADLHTAFAWGWNKRVGVLMNSEYVSGYDSTLPFGHVLKNHYYFEKVSEEGIDDTPLAVIQPPLILYERGLRLPIVFASFVDGTSIQTADGDADLGSFINGAVPPTANYTIERNGPLDDLRGGEVRQVADKVLASLDQTADSIATRFLNSHRYAISVEWESAAIYRLIGVPVGKNVAAADTYQYNSFLRSVRWYVTDDGAGTSMIFGNEDTFNPDIGEIRRQYLQYVAQRTSDQRETAFKELRDEIGRRRASEDSDPAG